MKKDKEWAKGQLEYYIKAVGNPFNSRTQSMINAYKNVEHIINQLDEPEKPVIPKFVADYIEKWKHEGLTIYEWFTFGDNDVDEDVNKWLYNNTIGENTRREYLLIDAIRNGYEVEKEPLYIIKFAPSIYGTPTYGSIGMQNGKKIMQSVYSTQKATIIPKRYTQKEIEEVGSEYMIFAEEVTE